MVVQCFLPIGGSAHAEVQPYAHSLERPLGDGKRIALPCTAMGYALLFDDDTAKCYVRTFAYVP